jgi:hypothetical protein
MYRKYDIKSGHLWVVAWETYKYNIVYNFWMSILLKVRKVGGSMMTTIPADEVKRLNLDSGDTVSAELKQVKKDMFGATKGKLGPFTREDREHDRE